MRKQAFLPPKLNGIVLTLLRLLLPFLERLTIGTLTVNISTADLEKLRAYRGQRMLLLPNHPTGEEPLVLFKIANRLKEVFYFVAAREVFEWEKGFRGWLIRRTGAYSLIRGTVDRESFMTSKRILMEGLHRLVIFIEGEISRETETLIPFEPGVVQLAFWAEEGLSKAYETANQSDSADRKTIPSEPSIFLAPIAIQYFFLPGYQNAVQKALVRLEREVGIQPQPQEDHYQRLRHVGLKILKTQETIHQLPHDETMTLTARVSRLKNRILEKIELFLGLSASVDNSFINRIRKIRNTMDQLTHSYDDPQDLTAYERRNNTHLRQTFNEFYQDLDRLVYFLLYDENYLRNKERPERFLEMLRRLEREVFGNPRFKYPRIAKVAVGNIIDCKAHLKDYEQNKKEYVRELTSALEDDMRQMIDQLKQEQLKSRP